MNVSSWSIRNPVPAVMLFVLLTFAGMLSFNAMKVQNFPDIDLPTISVVAVLPGASPAQLETEVARKLENSIATLQGLKHIYTTVKDGGVSITAEFRLEKPVQEAVDDVRAAVSRVRGDLPADVRDPVVSKIDIAGQPVLAFTIRSARMDDEALSWFVDNDISRKLLSVRGVGAVNRVGGVSREVLVALDPAKLHALGATASDVSRQLRQVLTVSAGGRAEVGGREQPMRTLATVKSAAELAKIELPLSDGRHVRLNEVATVSDTTAEPRAAALLDGKPVVGFEVARSRGESEVTVGAAVQKTLAELREARPDIELTEAFNFVKPVREEYDGSMHLLYEGGILAVLVVWLFLRDWRATFVSAVALPLSVIPAFIGMNLLGFSINVITLLALSLVIGILVDDAIVEVENIVRHLRMGKSPYQAAMEAADEIGLAVVATTFTLIAVFLPTAFMSGVAGKFFKQFGWTASLAVFASLVVARVLTPMMAAYILKPVVGTHSDPKWMQIYMRAAIWCMENRLKTMAMATVFFFGSVALVPLLPTGFLPPDDNSQTQIYLELPPGATLAQTSASAEHARLLISKVEHVRSVFSVIGSNESTPTLNSESMRKATLTVQLTERGERPRKQKIEEQIRIALDWLPGVKFEVGLGGSSNKYEIILVSDDPEALNRHAIAVEQDLQRTSNLGSIFSTRQLTRSEIAVNLDPAIAANMGVTSSAVSEALRLSTVGDYEVFLPKLDTSFRQIPIVVRVNDLARSDLSQLEQLLIPSVKKGAKPVMLKLVGSLNLTSGPAIIDRSDRMRRISIRIELSEVPLEQGISLIAQLPSIKNLPSNVYLINVGDAEAATELFENFGLAMSLGLVGIYITLVLLFRHYLHPLTILSVIPLSLGGGFLGLLTARGTFSMPALIGLVLLMGIATKNSILLVEYAIRAQKGGVSRFDSLRDACHKRARPIVMTTIAMGAGMMPVALGLGVADPSFRSPMAITVLGGLVTSTVLGLLIVPVTFLMLDDFFAYSFWKQLIPRPRHWL